MISFWTLAIAMLGFVLWQVSLPLMQRADEGQSWTNALVVSIHRREWGDIDREFLSGRITKEEHARRRLALENRILGDTAYTPIPGRGTRIVPVVLLAVLIPVTACALYVKLGNPAALTLNDPPAAERGARPPPIDIMVARLAYRLTDHAPDPADAKNWAILGRSYSVLDRPSDAVAAFQQAVALDPSNAALRADFADALASAKIQGNAQGNANADARAADQIDAALLLDPDDPKALSLAAITAFNRHSYHAAIDYWQRLRARLASDSPISIDAGKRIQDAIALSSVTVMVSFENDSNLPPLPGEVIVTARAADGEVLAARRVSANSLPAKVVLDDTLAPRPSAALSLHANVSVEARIEGSHAAGAVDVAPALQNRSAHVVISGAR